MRAHTGEEDGQAAFRVLIVEDDPVQLMQQRQIVESLGHSVVTAMTAMDAVRSIPESTFDVVLLDVHLPDGRGDEYLKPLIEASVVQPVIIVITISGDQDLRARCLAAGCDDFITKPMTRDEIGTRMVHACKNLRLRQQNQRIKDLNAYTRALAHDIGTPIAAIRMALSVLEESGLTAEQQHTLEDIRAANTMLAMQAQKALNHSQISAGNELKPAMQPLNIRKMTSDCVNMMMHYSSGHSSVQCLHEVEESVGEWLLTDPAWCWEMVTNLMSNALKFTHTGAVTLHIFVEEGDLLVEVEDTGKGIPEADLERVFQPFVQLQQNAGGTGLGLPSVAAKATALGGRAYARRNDETGSGSIFTVRFPYQVCDAPVVEGTAGNAPAVAAAQQDPVKVLVIDDTAVIRTLSKKMLSKQGAEVDLAENGQVGLNLMKQSEYDLVLCDVMMPVMDGLQCATLFREWETAWRPGKHQLIVGLTAQLTTDVEKECHEHGMDRAISKPLTKEVAAALVNKDK